MATGWGVAERRIAIEWTWGASGWVPARLRTNPCKHMRTRSATYTFLGAYQIDGASGIKTLFGSKPSSKIMKAWIRSASPVYQPATPWTLSKPTQHNEASLGSPPWIPLWTRPLNLMSHKSHQVNHIWLVACFLSFAINDRLNRQCNHLETSLSGSPELQVDDRLFSFEPFSPGPSGRILMQKGKTVQASAGITNSSKVLKEAFVPRLLGDPCVWPCRYDAKLLFWFVCMLLSLSLSSCCLLHQAITSPPCPLVSW